MRNSRSPLTLSNSDDALDNLGFRSSHKMAMCSQSHTKRNERQSSERFNSFCVIWLNNDSKSHQSVEEKLRDLGHHFIKFQEVTQCQKYIEKVSEGDRLMLLTTNSLGRKLTPLIHRFHQVLLIYIYYDDRRIDEHWAGQYEKVAFSIQVFCR